MMAPVTGRITVNRALVVGDVKSNHDAQPLQGFHSPPIIYTAHSYTFYLRVFVEEFSLGSFEGG